MNIDKNFKFPLDEYLDKFDKHLCINERTILSAKFGDGKSYFLNQFKKDYDSQYHFITLYPVNYSVAENDDIFEYIKRDIMLQLAQSDILSNIDFTTIADTIFSWENAKGVASFLLSALPQGELFNKILAKINLFYDEYEKKKKTYSEYIEASLIQRGGIYEHDAYTQIIEKAIDHLKKTKKVVLIIEDLDRIDPAHLFRLLNVLGAHLDHQYYLKANNSSNKFGFSKIITVFDYEITEHIFHHFYGENANYSGYINKFTSHQPFDYSINQVAIDYFNNYISTECGVSQTTINMLTKKDKMLYENLSIRDIQRTLFELERQIKNVVIDAGNGTIYTSVAPITKYIAVLKRIGYKENEISTHITNIKDTIELFQLINVFLLSNSIFATQSSIMYNNKYYYFEKKHNTDGIINNMTFIQSSSGTVFDMKEIKKAIELGIITALKHVH